MWNCDRRKCAHRSVRGRRSRLRGEDVVDIQQVNRARLTGRRILITGAASGIGRAIAELFAEEGARLALLDRDPENLRKVEAGLPAIAIPTDVASAQQV